MKIMGSAGHPLTSAELWEIAQVCVHRQRRLSEGSQPVPIHDLAKAALVLSAFC
jgi:hypothetical protein